MIYLWGLHFGDTLSSWRRVHHIEVSWANVPFNPGTFNRCCGVKLKCELLARLFNKQVMAKTIFRFGSIYSCSIKMMSLSEQRVKYERLWRRFKMFSLLHHRQSELLFIAISCCRGKLKQNYHKHNTERGEKTAECLWWFSRSTHAHTHTNTHTEAQTCRNWQNPWTSGGKKVSFPQSLLSTHRTEPVIG